MWHIAMPGAGAIHSINGAFNGSLGQDGVDLARHGFEHVLQELPGRLSVSRCHELGDGELGRPVDTHEVKELSLGGLHFGDVDVKEANGVALELLPLRLVSRHIRQARDSMSLQTSVQRRTRQVWDRGLKGVEAVVQRQQRVPSESHDHCFLGLGQDGGPRFRRSGLHVRDRRPLAPLRHRLRIDAELPAQLR